MASCSSIATVSSGGNSWKASSARTRAPTSKKYSPTGEAGLTILERNAVVGELDSVGARARGDELARRELILEVIHRLHRDELAGFEVTNTERAAVRVPAQHEVIVSIRQPHDDHLEIELIRPEPRHL